MIRALFSAFLILTIAASSAFALSGSYTIDNTQATSGNNYHSFTEAIAALNGAAITGPVIFTVSAGTYSTSSGETFPLVLSENSGSSAANTITFQATGSSTIQWDGAGNSNDPILSLSGAKYTTIDGVNFAGGNTAEIGVALSAASPTSGCQFDTLRNCTITMDKTNSFITTGVKTSASPSSANGANSYNAFLNVEIYNCTYGMYLQSSTGFRDFDVLIGSTSSDLGFAHRTKIGGPGSNSISNTGIYLFATANGIIQDCDISNITSGLSSAVRGVYCNNSGANTVQRCRFFDITNTFSGSYSSTVAGIYIDGAFTIRNNMFWNISLPNATSLAVTPTVRAIHMQSTAASLNEVSNNTIDLPAVAANYTVAGMFTSYPASHINTIKNNIISNRTLPVAGKARYCIYENTTSQLVSDYNCFNIVSATNHYVYRKSTSNYTSLADWQASAGSPDAHSNDGDPLFVSPGSDLHIQTSTSSSVWNTGTPISGITTDIEGDIRDATHPFIGADEVMNNWHQTVSSTGPGGTNAWTPTLPPDPSTNNQPAAGVSFGGLGAGSNPTGISIRYDNFSNVITLWGVSNSELTSALPSNQSVNRLWEVTQTGGSGFSATLQLSFTVSDLPPAITDPVTQILYATTKHGSNPWISIPCVVTGPVSGVYTATISNVTEFSLWGLGTDPVLPVELSSFSAVNTIEGIVLFWRTESETNNYWFRLYRSAEGETELISQLSGHGTTSTPNNYRFVDTRVQNGVSYTYQLADVDGDGVEHIVRTIEIMARFTDSPIVSEFALQQNYPNPFNPSTKIDYSIASAGKVTLTVFDITGKEVTRLVDRNQAAGNYSIGFDATHLAAGVYFYRLTSDGTADLKKMILMK